MFTRAIVRPPAANFFAGLTTAGLGAPDYETALRQHEAYCEALERCGLTLERLEVDSEHPDSTFVEDTAVLVGTAGSPLAILTRPGAASRRGEVTSIRHALEHFYPAPAILAIESPGTVDGGDICQAGDHFFIGLSERTNENGAHQLAGFLETLGYLSSMIDIRRDREVKSAPGASFPLPLGEGRVRVSTKSRIATGCLLHLKSGLAYLGANHLVVTKTLADREELAGFQLVEVSQAEEYAANCVRVNDNVLVAAGYPLFQSKLQELGYQTISLEMSEFQKMDGGLSCLSLRF